MNRAGILKAEMRGSRKASQLLLRQTAGLVRVDHGDRHLAQPVVRHSEHAGLGDGGAGVDLRFDLGAGDILAAADDDVLLAVDDEQIAVLVDVADVAGADVAVRGEGGARSLPGPPNSI